MRHVPVSHHLHDRREGSDLLAGARTSCLFTDPATGRRHGYFDGWDQDGVYHYYGEGQLGDQRMISGNGSVLNHEKEGRTLRLFEGSRAQVTYMGEFELDPAEPWYETDAPETGNGPIRKVIVFRLRPVDVSPKVGKAPLPAPVEADVVDIVPVEEQYTERAFVNPSQEQHEAERREAKLVLALRDHLWDMGHEVGRLKIIPAGEAKPLFADLYDQTADVLVEAKGSVAREAVRIALGELADYGRFRPEAARVILLPECPRKDLITLINSQGITAVWPDDGRYKAEPGLPW
jgi:hypothetical protein